MNRCMEAFNERFVLHNYNSAKMQFVSHTDSDQVTVCMAC